MRFYHTPKIIQALFSGWVWRKPVSDKIIYLTFDDGPIPEVTEFVLTELEKNQAQATFFWVGDNMVKHPDLAQKVILAGHQIGNHTYNHLKGWETSTEQYIQNIEKCEDAITKLNIPNRPKLFRPPHGRFTRAQAKLIKPDFQVIMWDVLTYDFDQSLASEQCLSKAIKNTKPGSIVVFHDSLKARRNLEYVLPRYLAHFANLGYRFHSL